MLAARRAWAETLSPSPLESGRGHLRCSACRMERLAQRKRAPLKAVPIVALVLVAPSRLPLSPDARQAFGTQCRSDWISCAPCRGLLATPSHVRAR